MPIFNDKGFKGKENEIWKAIKMLVWNMAMDMFGVRYAGSWFRWMREHPDTEGNGKEQFASSYMGLGQGDKPLVEMAVERVEATISNLKARIALKDERIEFLERQLELYKKRDYESFASKVYSIIKACEA